MVLNKETHNWSKCREYKNVCGVFNQKWNINMTSPSPLPRLGDHFRREDRKTVSERGQGELERLCLLDMLGLPHSWPHSSCGWPPKTYTRSGKLTLQHGGQRAPWVPYITEELQSATSRGEKSGFVSPLEGWPCSDWWLCTHEHIWAAQIDLVTYKTNKGASSECWGEGEEVGLDLRGDRGRGLDLTKVHFIHVWNPPRIG